MNACEDFITGSRKALSRVAIKPDVQKARNPRINCYHPLHKLHDSMKIVYGGGGTRTCAAKMRSMSGHRYRISSVSCSTQTRRPRQQRARRHRQRKWIWQPAATDLGEQKHRLHFCNRNSFLGHYFGGAQYRTGRGLGPIPQKWVAHKCTWHRLFINKCRLAAKMPFRFTGLGWSPAKH